MGKRDIESRRGKVLRVEFAVAFLGGLEDYVCVEGSVEGAGAACM
jgi:hypothetical protein